MENRRHHAVLAAALRLYRQGKPQEKLAEPRHFRVPDQSQFPAQISRAHHADGDRLAVIVPHIVRFLLDGVAHRMAEIEDRPEARLLFVLRHHFRLDLAGPDDEVLHRLGLNRKDRIAMRLQIGEKGLVRNHAVFHDLAEPRGKLPLRQRSQAGKVDENAFRLVKGADQILAEAMVDRHFPADAGIHLRQEAGRHLHKRNATHIRRGDEARQISNHAAAQRDDRRFAVKSRADSLRINVFRFLQGFRVFPRRNEVNGRLLPRPPEKLRGFLPIDLSHVRIGNHQDAGRKIRVREKRNDRFFYACPNQNVVAVPRQIDSHFTHE